LSAGCDFDDCRQGSDGNASSDYQRHSAGSFNKPPQQPNMDESLLRATSQMVPHQKSNRSTKLAWGWNRTALGCPHRSIGDNPEKQEQRSNFALRGTLNPWIQRR
jgi:hypothetical protein